MLGARINSDEDREAFMAVWTYDGWVMGVPDELIRHSQAEWLRLYEVGSMCEPPPDIDAIALANCIINSAPVVIGMTEPRERADYARYAYRISRELIGDERADQLNFPPGNRFPTLPWLRAQEHLKRRLGKFLPLMRTTRRRRSFTHLLGLTDLGEAGISYRLPDHVRSDASSRW